MLAQGATSSRCASNTHSRATYVLHGLGAALLVQAFEDTVEEVGGAVPRQLNEQDKKFELTGMAAAARKFQDVEQALRGIGPTIGVIPIFKRQLYSS